MKMKWIQPGFLSTIASRIYEKVEEVKISLKTNGLEKKIDKDIALLGEKIFAMNEKNPSRIIQDKTILEWEAHITNDRNRLLEIKRGHLQRVTRTKDFGPATPLV
jgi:glucan phosphorylase